MEPKGIKVGTRGEGQEREVRIGFSVSPTD